MDRAFVLTLLQENDRLREQNEELSKMMTKIEMTYADDGVTSVARVHGLLMANCFWERQGTVLWYAHRNTPVSAECAKFTKDMIMPDDTDYFKLTSGWSSMTYTHDGFILQTSSAVFGIAFVNEKDGFDIMRRIRLHMNIVIVRTS
jgi:hypothetical protein